MNSVQRRVFRAFVESGGDLTHEGNVDLLIQNVNASVWVMPPKVKRALQMALHAEERLAPGARRGYPRGGWIGPSPGPRAPLEERAAVRSHA